MRRRLPTRSPPCAAPDAVSVAGDDGARTRLDVTVPATALGLTGDDSVTLQATIVDGQLGSVDYTTTVAGAPAAVASTFAPPIDPSPVVAPV